MVIVHSYVSVVQLHVRPVRPCGLPKQSKPNSLTMKTVRKRMRLQMSRSLRSSLFPCCPAMFAFSAAFATEAKCGIRCPLPLLHKSAAALKVAQFQCNTTKLKSATMANTSWSPSAAGHSDQRHKIITGAKWLPKFISGHTSQPLGFLQFGLLCFPDCSPAGSTARARCSGPVVGNVPER